VGAAAGLRVGVGAGARELFFFVGEHLDAQCSHHQGDDDHRYREYYKYGFHIVLLTKKPHCLRLPFYFAPLEGIGAISLQGKPLVSI
jgi:hypothetical protein